MNEVTRTLVIEMLKIAIQILLIAFLPMVYRAIKNFTTHIEAQIGKTNYDKGATMIKDIVYAIEQLYPDLVGSEKYKKAMYAINDKLGALLTAQEIDTLIESTVANINIITKKGTSISS